MILFIFFLSMFGLSEIFSHESEQLIALSLVLAGFLLTTIFSNVVLLWVSAQRAQYCEAIRIASLMTIIPLKNCRQGIKTEPLFNILPKIVKFFINWNIFKMNQFKNIYNNMFELNKFSVALITWQQVYFVIYLFISTLLPINLILLEKHILIEKYNSNDRTYLVQNFLKANKI